MSLSLSFDPSLQKAMEAKGVTALQSTGTSTSTTGVGNSEDIAPGFAGNTFEPKLANSNSSNPLVFHGKNSDNGTGGVDTNGMETQGKQAMSDGNAQMSKLQSANTQFDNKMHTYSGQIGSNTENVGTNTALMLGQGKILEQKTAQQEKTAAWLETTSATLDQLQEKITQLESEALGKIPAQLNINPSNLEEAMAQLQDLLQGDKFNEYQQKLQDQQKCQEELQNLDPNDPKYPEKQKELANLTSEINNNPDYQNIQLAQQAMGDIADYADSIALVRQEANEYSTQIATKQDQIAQTSQQITDANSNVEKANSKVKTASTTIQNSKDDADNATDPYEEIYTGVRIGGTATAAVGDMITKTGEMLSNNEYTAAVGTILKAVGTGVTYVGEGMQAGADIAEGINNNDTDLIFQGVNSAITATGKAASTYASMGVSGEFANVASSAAQSKADAASAKAAEIAKSDASTDVKNAAVAKANTAQRKADMKADTAHKLSGGKYGKEFDGTSGQTVKDKMASYNDGSGTRKTSAQIRGEKQAAKEGYVRNEDTSTYQKRTDNLENKMKNDIHNKYDDKIATNTQKANTYKAKGNKTMQKMYESKAENLTAKRNKELQTTRQKAVVLNNSGKYN